MYLIIVAGRDCKSALSDNFSEPKASFDITIKDNSIDMNGTPPLYYFKPIIEKKNGNRIYQFIRKTH